MTTISSNWIKESSPDETISFLKELALLHAQDCCAADREFITNCIVNGDLLSLANHSPSLDASPFAVYSASQCSAFFKKLECLDLGIDRERVAFSKWRESEDRCRQTNELFAQARDASVEFLDRRTPAWIHHAKRRIARVLGNLPRPDELDYRFGPGSTTTIPRRSATPLLKLQELACSEDILPILPEILAEMPGLCGAHDSESSHESFKVSVKITEDILEFVPKNFKTFRAITKTATLNSLVQLAIGDHMARRLRMFGIDISDQSQNQKLALKGSLDGSLATLDLSSASDTISTEIVYELLPVDWFFLLDRARSRKVTYKKEKTTIDQEKFCSMGNGFTFPLETLIFDSIVWAAIQVHDEEIDDDGEHNSAVHSTYGDDIIVSTRYYHCVVSALTAFGFVVNDEKSFSEGPFRESCGKDYHSGIDVRPVYAKNALTQAELFRLHNFYFRRNLDEYADWVLQWIHPALQIFGPDGYGDGHLLTKDSFSYQSRRRSMSARGYSGYTFDTFKLNGQHFWYRLQEGDFVHALYATYRSNTVTMQTQAMNAFRSNRSSLEFKLPGKEAETQFKGDKTKITLLGSKGYHRISIYTLDH